MIAITVLYLNPAALIQKEFPQNTFRSESNIVSWGAHIVSHGQDYLNIVDSIVESFPSSILGPRVVQEERVHSDRHNHLERGKVFSKAANIGLKDL